MPLGHREGGKDGGGDLFAPEAEALPRPDSGEATRSTRIKPLLEDPGVLKIGQNLKFDWQIFARRGIDMRPYDDTMLMSYVLDAGRGGHGMDELAEKWLGHKTDPLRAGHRHRQVAGDVRLRDDREGRRIRRRGRRRHAAAVAGAEAAAGRRAGRDRLRDAGAAAGSGAGAHGAARHLDRPAGAVAAVRRVRAEAGRARGRDQQARRRAAQSRQPEAARRHPVRQDGPARRHQDQDRPMVDRRDARSRSWPSRATSCRSKILDWRQVSKLRSTYTDALPDYVNAETQRVHTCYALAATTDRPAVVVRAEPAEHPDPHRGRPQDPPRLRRRRRAPSSSPPTIRRSSCGCSPRSPTCRRCARRSRTASTFTP